MPTAAPELDDADKAVLVALLHQVIAADPVSAFAAREPPTGDPLQAGVFCSATAAIPRTKAVSLAKLLLTRKKGRSR